MAYHCPLTPPPSLSALLLLSGWALCSRSDSGAAGTGSSGFRAEAGAGGRGGGREGKACAGSMQSGRTRTVWRRSSRCSTGSGCAVLERSQVKSFQKPGRLEPRGKGDLSPERGVQAIDEGLLRQGWIVSRVCVDALDGARDGLGAALDFRPLDLARLDFEGRVAQPADLDRGRCPFAAGTALSHGVEARKDAGALVRVFAVRGVAESDPGRGVRVRAAAGAEVDLPDEEVEASIGVFGLFEAVEVRLEGVRRGQGSFALVRRGDLVEKAADEVPAGGLRRRVGVERLGVVGQGRKVHSPRSVLIGGERDSEPGPAGREVEAGQDAETRMLAILCGVIPHMPVRRGGRAGEELVAIRSDDAMVGRSGQRRTKARTEARLKLTGCSASSHCKRRCTWPGQSSIDCREPPVAGVRVDSLVGVEPRFISSTRLHSLAASLRPASPSRDVQPPRMAARKRFRSAHDPALALGDPLVPAAARRRLLAGSQFDVNHWTRQTAHRAHHSCVNALALSPGSARFLASAGDDHRVLLWDSASPDLDPHTGLAPDPVASYTGALVGPALSGHHPVIATDSTTPQSNIFTIAFSADGRKLLSYASLRLAPHEHEQR